MEEQKEFLGPPSHHFRATRVVEKDNVILELNVDAFVKRLHRETSGVDPTFTGTETVFGVGHQHGD